MNAVARYLLPQDVCLDLDVASKRQLFHAIGQHMHRGAAGQSQRCRGVEIQTGGQTDKCSRRNCHFFSEPAVEIDTGTLRYEQAVITFEPRPARLEVEPVPLDDPTLTANWDRGQLWRAVAVYADATTGSVRMTVSRA